MLLQFILILFLLFAVSRVLMQLKHNKLTPKSFLFWGSIFVIAIFGVLQPEVTTKIARILGIGRGTDAVIYFSIVIIFYLVFRLTIAIEDIRNEITEIIRHIGFKDEKLKKKKS